MLHFDKVQTIEGVTVYGDDEKDYLYYILPDSPRFRLDENGKPVFKFLKYKTPIERQVAPANGTGAAQTAKKGGFCNFDVEFVVSEEKEKKVKEALEAQLADKTKKIEIGRLSYIGGTASLLITTADNKLVEKLNAVGKPSLYGKNISSFSLELSEDGAPVFEQALQGGGGFVQVAYALRTYARLQGATVNFSIDSSSSHTFVDDVKASEGTSFWHDGKFEEKIEDVISRTESNYIKIDFGAISETAKDSVREWAHEQFAEAVRRKIDIIKPIPDDGRGNKASGGRDTTSLLNILQSEDFSIQQTYAENTSIEWSINPNGTLPNITTLPGWNEADKKKYFDSVSTEDPFFKSIEVRSRVNADFANLPIYNVTVLVDYDEPRSFVFNSADTVQRYQRYLKADQTRKYKYKYEVNYKNSSKSFKSPEIESESSDLSIGIDDLGLLLVNVEADATLDFSKVSSARVSFRYEDTKNSIGKIEKTFSLASDKKTFAFQEVLGKPWTEPYEYQIEYIVNGRKLTKGWEKASAKQLFVGSPFSEKKSYRLIGQGFSKIKTIYLDMVYEEVANKHRQTQSVSITENAAPAPWEVQTIDPQAGKLTYTGSIVYQDGTLEDIPLTECPVDKTVIVVGKADPKPATVVKKTYKLIGQGFPAIETIYLDLVYEEAANKLRQTKSLSLSQSTKSLEWEVSTVDLKAAKLSYSGVIVYKDGKQEEIPMTDSPVDKSNIFIGKVGAEPSKLSVTVNTDLIDWTDASLKLKLAVISLKYDDDDSNIHEGKSLTFKNNATAAQTWEVTIKNPAKKSYQWRAVYHTGQGKKETDWKQETDTELFPDSGDVKSAQ
jgi:hypothetical protein